MNWAIWLGIGFGAISAAFLHVGADPKNPPYFQIDIQNAGLSSGDAYRIQIDAAASLFRLFGYGGGIATAAKIDTSKPLDSFQEPIRSSLERLVETQISSLPSQ